MSDHCSPGSSPSPPPVKRPASTSPPTPNHKRLARSESDAPPKSLKERRDFVFNNAGLFVKIGMPVPAALMTPAPPTDISEIIPNLFLGNATAASNKKLLEKHQIEAILNMTDTPSQTTQGIVYLQLPIKDDGQSTIFPYFERSNKFICENLKAGKKVFIHCFMGISRSPAIVIAYLMMAFSMKYENALELVRTKRPCVDCKLNFVGDLQKFEKTLQLEAKSPAEPVNESPASESFTCTRVESTGEFPDESSGEFSDESSGEFPDGSSGEFPNKSSGEFPNKSPGEFPDTQPSHKSFT